MKTSGTLHRLFDREPLEASSAAICRLDTISAFKLGCATTSGAVLARMRIYDSALCVITSHFASGHREGDELRRNLDYSEIYRRAEFPQEIDSYEAEPLEFLPEGLPYNAPKEGRAAGQCGFCACRDLLQ